MIRKVILTHKIASAVLPLKRVEEERKKRKRKKISRVNCFAILLTSARKECAAPFAASSQWSP